MDDTERDFLLALFTVPVSCCSAPGFGAAPHSASVSYRRAHRGVGEGGQGEGGEERVPANNGMSKGGRGG